MIFKVFDRVIDRVIGRIFSQSRKIGRRSEKVYYTAYKDWLVYCSRRSHDNSVKITLGLLFGFYTYLSCSLQNLLLSKIFQDYQTPSQHKQLLEEFLKHKKVSNEPHKPIVYLSPKLSGEDDRIFNEFLAQRDK
jgi:hypothetical protein